MNDAAAVLKSRIEAIAQNFVGEANPQVSIELWMKLHSALVEFIRATPQSSVRIHRKTIGFIDSLSMTLSDVRDGRPSFLRHFDVLSGQHQSMSGDIYLVQCSLAVTLLLKANVGLEEACKQIAKKMKSAGLPFPIKRRKSVKVRSDSPVADWMALQNWRRKLMAGNHGSELKGLYQYLIKGLHDDLPASKWREGADSIMKTLSDMIPA